MVSTHLKNISQIGTLPQIGVKIKNIWNHHLGEYFTHVCQHSNLSATHVHPHPSSMGSDVPVLADLQGWFVKVSSIDFFLVLVIGGRDYITPYAWYISGIYYQFSCYLPPITITWKICWLVELVEIPEPKHVIFLVVAATGRGVCHPRNL